MSNDNVPWPHAPTHQLSQRGTYFITASTYLKEHFFNDAKRLGVLQRGILRLCHEYSWRLEAWAVFSNHYHFVGHSPENDEKAKTLSPMLKRLHAKTAAWVNRLDGAAGREVWHNFWDTRLTFQRSYLARLNYVHQNPVKHRLVPVANAYPWCSAGWFERTAPEAVVKCIYRFKIDAVNVEDDYEPIGDW